MSPYTFHSSAISSCLKRTYPFWERPNQTRFQKTFLLYVCSSKTEKQGSLTDSSFRHLPPPLGLLRESIFVWLAINSFILKKSRSSLHIHLYGYRNDRRSLGENLVTWRSKKQSVVARSSKEAEHRAIAQGISEHLWLQKLLGRIEIVLKRNVVYCNYKAAISIAQNHVQQDRTKHIEIEGHFIKEKVTSGTKFASCIDKRTR